MQNEDGSPHDKSKGKKGKIPRWLNKKIVKKGKWDYNDKRKSFFGSAVCAHVEVGIQYSYSDGTTVFQADNPFTIPLSSFESGWTLLPIPLAG